MTQLTKSQEQAILSQSKRLLVSASAGCGKTTVMIERICNLILSKQTTVDNIVVVTFTNLAAQEMKNRLIKKLSEKAKDKDIQEQASRVDYAAVCTIHAFCLQLLKNYFYVLGIDPSFSIMDKTVSVTYRTRVLDDVISQYANAGDKVFDDLYKVLCNNRKEDGLRAQILRLYDFSVCFADFEKFYGITRDFYNFDSNSAFSRLICDDYIQGCNTFADILENLATRAKQYGASKLAEFCIDSALPYRIPVDASLEAVYSHAVGKEKDKTFTSLLKKHDKSFSADEETFALLTYEIEQKKKGARDFVKKYVDLFDKPLQVLIEQSQQSAILLDKLVEVTRTFEEKYFAYKTARGYLDFSDLEKLTLKLLDSEQVQREIAQKYTHIFVDEYQDVNNVQEALIDKLSRNASFFAVGDVKQSIYGFRQCNPDIFAAHLEKANADSETERVNLGDNFRSNVEILRKTNEIFSCCMTKSFGNVDYKKEAMLSGDRQLGLWEQKVAFVGVSKKKSAQGAKPTKVYDITQEVEEEGEGYAIAEACEVVKLINSLVGSLKEFPSGDKIVKRPVRYSDIAILSRKVKADAEILYNALVAENIPVSVSLADKFSTKEFGDLLSFLRVLDNPLDDVSFCGLALSFIGKFTKDDLARIVLNTPQDYMSNRFLSYIGNHDDDISKKAIDLLELTHFYRIKSFSQSVDRLLCDLIRQTEYDLYVLTLSNGKVRNNRMFANINSAKGKPYSLSVAKYIQQIEQFSMQEREIEQLYNDGVLLTSIHKSKGLEFPIVIGVGLSSARQSNRDKVCLCDKVGLAMNYFDFDSRTEIPSLSLYAASLSMELREREEELRLLYVLTTRAIGALYLVASNDEKCPTSPRRATTLGDFLTYAMQYVKIDKALMTGGQIKPQTFLPPQQSDDGSFERNFSFVYDRQFLPVKVTASGLKAFLGNNYPTGDDEEKDRKREKFLLSILPKSEERSRIETSQEKDNQNRQSAVRPSNENIQPSKDNNAEISFESNSEKIQPSKDKNAEISNEYSNQSTKDRNMEISNESSNENIQPSKDNNADISFESNSEDMSQTAATLYDVYQQGDTATSLAFEEEIVLDKPALVAESVEMPNYAQIGTAYHKVCEQLGLNCTLTQTKNAMEKLVQEGKIERVVADKLDLSCIVKTFSNPALAPLLDGEVHHEISFMAYLPFSCLIEGASDGLTVLQGVMDLLVIQEGRVNILDFKYTHNTKTIRENYHLQMNAYRQAAMKILGEDNVNTYIVSIDDGKIVKMD